MGRGRRRRGGIRAPCRDSKPSPRLVGDTTITKPNGASPFYSARQGSALGQLFFRCLLCRLSAFRARARSTYFFDYSRNKKKKRREKRSRKFANSNMYMYMYYVYLEGKGMNWKKSSLRNNRGKLNFGTFERRGQFLFSFPLFFFFNLFIFALLAFLLPSSSFDLSLFYYLSVVSSSLQDKSAEQFSIAMLDHFSFVRRIERNFPFEQRRKDVNVTNMKARYECKTSCG